MDHATETDADVTFGKVSEINEHLTRLLRDIESGKEPPSCSFPVLRSEFGRKMTPRIVKERIKHIQLKAAELAKELGRSQPIEREED